MAPLLWDWTSETNDKRVHERGYLTAFRGMLAMESLARVSVQSVLQHLEHEAEDDKTERSAFTLFPRYHQSRLVRRVAEAVLPTPSGDFRVIAFDRRGWGKSTADPATVHSAATPSASKSFSP